MSQPVTLQSSFKRGMVRDFPRDQMPANTAWDLKDFIPNLDGEVLSKRGGWSYASPSLFSTTGSASGMYGVYSAPFAAGDKLIGFSRTSYSVDISSSTSSASISSSDGVLLYGPATMLGDRMFYPTTGGIRTYTGTGSTSSVSLAPGGQTVANYRSSLVTGESTNLYFSKPGDYSVWDQTNGFISVPSYIIGLAPLSSVLIVFTTNGVLRVRGAPPLYTGSTAQVSPDLTLDTIFAQSALLYRSHVVVDDRCYFATSLGLHVTDGAGVTDLTEESGFSRYWRDSFATINPRGAFDGIILGAYRQYILCSPLYGYLGTFGTANDNNIGTLVYNTIDKSWFRITNLLPSMYTTSKAAGETYFSLMNSPRVGKVSTIFDPTSTVKADADGTAIQPALETPYYSFRPHGIKRFRHLYVNHDIRDASTDNPTLTVSYAKNPEDTSYTSADTLAETTEFARKRVAINRTAQGMSFKIAQTNNSSATRIFDLEADVHAREPSRR